MHRVIILCLLELLVVVERLYVGTLAKEWREMADKNHVDSFAPCYSHKHQSGAATRGFVRGPTHSN
jgi:hypothetical protein